MKEALTKVTDTLTQEDIHWTFQKLLERFNECLAAGGDYIEMGLEFQVCTINKSAHTKKVWKLILWFSYDIKYSYVMQITCSQFLFKLFLSNTNNCDFK